MNLKTKFDGVIGDHFPDKEEAEGISNHLLYYAYRHSKGAFASGLVIGVIGLSILLLWLA